MNPSTALATVLIDELIAGGVRDAVLCPGSRNAPISLALASAAESGRIRLHVRFDERTAGFLALGLAKASGHPVPVATTSGTAVANLHPAVLEADRSGIPVLVLSADRPPRLRDVGANQVIDQRAVFTGALRLGHEFGVPARVSGQNGPWRAMVCRALAAASGATGRPGPVQLNLPFDTPLVPDADNDRADNDRADDDHPGDAGSDNPGPGGPGPGSPAAGWPESLAGRTGPWTEIAKAAAPGGVIDAPRPGERCLVIADIEHSAVADLAAAGYPVISEAGGFGGAHVLAAGIHLLGNPDYLRAHRPDRVIVLGRPTLYRPVATLLADPAVRVEVVAGAGDYADIAGTAHRVAPRLGPIAVNRPDCPWMRAWRDADRAAGAAAHRVIADGRAAGGISSPALAATIAAALPDGANLVLGSSQIPRDFGRFAGARDGIRVLANRGVAGIDGTNSTAIGIALASAAPTVAVLGDLTFLHDVTGLAIGPGEPRPDVTILVANNDGGAIFATLEPGQPRFADRFERVFAVPVGADIAALAAGFGAGYTRAEDLETLPARLAVRPSGIHVIEVPVDRAGLRRLLGEVDAAVAEAI